MNDNSLMPFGAHKGKKMVDVPVEYLHWVWLNATGTHATIVKQYIKDNLDALKMENKDLIWR